MRIPGVSGDQGPLAVRLLFRVLGKVPAPLRIYGRRPNILLTFLSLGRAVRRQGELPERLKRLAMYRTARVIECAF
ncbi:hypothetical protein [Geoalkalibacter halelectricus]|uniref:hypothetical protein n=1 Tax=Geoalkalibacter halelectricus TaxID=2847045 RepID=UPI003D1FE4E8